MSEATYNNIMIMLDSIDEHRELVEKRVDARDVDPAVLESIAKYWTALERLAAE